MAAVQLPIRRNLRFNLPADRVSNWHKAGVHVSHFFNTLSIFFPVGERFFIDSVRHYRDRIDDPQLKEAVRAFIGQEALHGREHDEYNEHLVAAGLGTDRMEARVERILKEVQRFTPKQLQLAVTIALEHLTALLADAVLSTPELLDGAEPHYAGLWMWHAMEETEHKGVAYDVYEKVVGKGIRAWALRSFALVLATGIFWALFYPFYIQVIRRQKKLTDLRGWWASFSYQWLYPGTLRRMVPAWFEFFRPGFHPWDHDNSHYLERADELVEAFGDTPAKAAASA